MASLSAPCAYLHAIARQVSNEDGQLVERRCWSCSMEQLPIIPHHLNFSRSAFVLSAASMGAAALYPDTAGCPPSASTWQPCELG